MLFQFREAALVACWLVFGEDEYEENKQLLLEPKFKVIFDGPYEEISESGRIN